MDPRVVMIRRETAYEALLREHGTIQMAEFRLKNRGETLDGVRARHEAVLGAAKVALGRVPTTWRKTWALRKDLDRFRFDPEDIVVAVGLDGLVPNVAKYLDGQPVIGVNPTEWPQRMMHFTAADLPHLYASGVPHTEARTMVEVALEDGRSLVALNEIFCGHRTHQSAKYDLAYGGTEEYQSSSGLIVATGTGATGWASSIVRATSVAPDELPQPTDPAVYYLVREAWSSSFTGGTLLRGRVGDGSGPIAKVERAKTSKRLTSSVAGNNKTEFARPASNGTKLSVTSKMQEGGVLFGDGIESDALSFAWGQKAHFKAAGRCLRLAVA